MSLALFLNFFLSINLLVLAGFGCLLIFNHALRIKNLHIASGTQLRLHYSVMGAIFVLILVHPFFPTGEVFRPAAKIWSAPSLSGFDSVYSQPHKKGVLSFSPPSTGARVFEVKQLELLALFVVLLFLSIGSFRLFRDFALLFRIKKSSLLIRSLGEVRIYVSESILVPFSFWWPGKAIIVLPASMIGKGRSLQIAVAHELQHHRQGDTKWIFVFLGMRGICFVNPLMHLWTRWISEIQEFACDEALVDHKKVNSQAYASCLVEVAKTAIEQKNVPVCATGFLFLHERKLLKRRIEKMLEEKQLKKGKWMSSFVGGLILSLLVITAYASQGLVQDRRVSMDQAKAMVERARGASQFPIVLNERVLRQLNRFIGTPEGRDFIKKSLARMESYKETVRGNLQKYNVPLEIMALPIVESGYRNLPERQSNPNKAAGLWQFIPSTARNFGLQVDKLRDDRNDIDLDTDAAMRYLQSNNLRFKDWHLSVLAYNMGEKAVQKGIEALKSRDAWTLIQNGYEGDKDYLPKVMAAILIMKNPETIL